MKAYVIGATGHLGTELVRRIEKLNIPVIKTYASTVLQGGTKFDLSQDDPVLVFGDLQPDDVVFILSAISNPDAVVINPIKAMSVNVNGTISLIDFINSRGSRIVFLSSVEVFDGKKEAYRETDTPNPLNLYGLTKWRVEQYLQQFCSEGNFTIVRVCWNIGPTVSSRCVVRLTFESLLSGNCMMAKDNYFNVISTQDTIRLLLKLINLNPLPIEIIHCAADEVIVRSTLAQRILVKSIHSSKMSFEECQFDQLKFLEPRARNNILNNALSKKLLGMDYQPAWDVIDAKIAAIDLSKQ
jgi:dTDP-4-dehydrorhamnose reductase